MIEILSVFLIIIVDLLADFLKEEYFYSIYNAITTAVNFFIAIRLFQFLLQSNYLSQNLKALAFSAVYSVFILDAILGLAYFIGYFDNNAALKTFAKTVIAGSVYAGFLYIKHFDFKSIKELGKTYTVFQCIDIFLVTLMLSVCVIVDAATLAKASYVSKIVIVLLIIDTAVFLFTLSRHKFWFHKKILSTKMDILLKSDKIEEYLKKPLKRSISEDFLLPDCIYIMERSFIRAYSLNNICKDFFKKCKKEAVKPEKAIEYSAMLSAVLMANLMKRDLDFVVMPTMLMNPIQFIVREIKYRKLEKAKSL